MSFNLIKIVGDVLELSRLQIHARQTENPYIILDILTLTFHEKHFSGETMEQVQLNEKSFLML